MKKEKRVSVRVSKVGKVKGEWGDSKARKRERERKRAKRPTIVKIY